MNRARLLVVGGAVLLGGAGLWLARGDWPRSREPAARDPRVERVALAAPGWSEPRIVAGLAAGDALPAAVSVPERLAAAQPTEAELVALHAANTDVFGGRPYVECRDAAETLWKIHHVRRELGLADPESGVVWPEDAAGVGE
jgi:hypothetical protein